MKGGRTNGNLKITLTLTICLQGMPVCSNILQSHAYILLFSVYDSEL
jgi:hypothetical protein